MEPIQPHYTNSPGSSASGEPIDLDEPFRRLVEGVRDYAIFLLDPEGRVASWNLGAERIKGYRAEEIVGRHFSAFYPREAIDKRWPEHELETAARLGRFEDEAWRVRKDGSQFWADVVITAIRDDDGRLVGFSKITRDLTERREHDERLRESEERFRLLVEAVQDYAIFMLDPDGRVVSWNVGAERILGYGPRAVIGKHFSVFFPEELRGSGEPRRELEDAARVGRHECEGWRMRADGTRFWANVVVTALRGADGGLRGFSKITRDLTERREHDERLRESEERFRLLLEGVEDYAIYMLDPEGRVTSWNVGAERITGYAAAEIIGQSFERFYPRQDVAAGKPAQELRLALLQRRVEDQGWRLRKDGSRFWADVVVTSLTDPEGRLRGFAKVVRDLSERKRMERLEEQGKNVTEFLAMLAHELRNPLAPIRSALAVMDASRGDPDRIEWSRQVIDRQSAHLTRLVDDLLDVSRITRGKLRMQRAPMDLRTAIARALEASRPLIESRRHRLAVEAEAPLPVHGDLTRLAQALLNLLNNAAKYTPEGGRIVVLGRQEDDECVVRVRDTGVGIPRPVLEQVFDLFAQGERTLDRSEGGLGIGLTLARRIVLLHGGAIEAHSEGTGRGAEFVMRLPRLHEEIAEARPVPRLEPGHTGHKRDVLVVDDNADAADSMAMLLRMAGHEVRVEHDGEGALAQAASRAPDVVLLDIGLPGIDGYEVARRLRASAGGRKARIYALTGYGQDEDRRRSLASGFDGHLVKPVMPGDLFALVEGGPGQE